MQRAQWDLWSYADTPDHLPAEDRSSMSLEIWMADYVIDNNGGLEDLRRNTRELLTTLLKVSF